MEGKPKNELHPPQAGVATDAAPHFADANLGALFDRLKGVGAGLRETALGSLAGFGAKQARLLDILLTFLDEIKKPTTAPVAAESTEGLEHDGANGEGVTNTFSMEEVREDLRALQSLLKDADLPETEKAILDRYCNELLVQLTDLIDSFELYKNSSFPDKAMWPLTGPFLRDKLLAYIVKHKSTMSLSASLDEFQNAVQRSIESGAEMGSTVLVLRQKIAQGAWKEVVSSAIEEAQMLGLDLSQERVVIDTELLEREQAERTLRLPLWTESELRAQHEIFQQIEQAIQKHFPNEVTTDLRTLWALAEGSDTSLLEKQTAATILLGAEHLLKSLREARFIQILARFMEGQGNEAGEETAS